MNALSRASNVRVQSTLGGMSFQLDRVKRQASRLVCDEELEHLSEASRVNQEAHRREFDLQLSRLEKLMQDIWVELYAEPESEPDSESVIEAQAAANLEARNASRGEQR